MESKKRQEVLQPDAMYHVYNRAHGRDKLFLNIGNYEYFMYLIRDYVTPLADIYCYCLMPNHFHFILKMKPEEELLEYFKQEFRRRNEPESIAGRGKKVMRPSKTLQALVTLEGCKDPHYKSALYKLLTQQFAHLFNAYTQAFNKNHKRRGSLLMHPYKRIKVRDEKYLLTLVLYIHKNPLEAQLCHSLSDWPYSSYRLLYQKDYYARFIQFNRMVNWFHDHENFIATHTMYQNDTDFEEDLKL